MVANVSWTFGGNIAQLAAQLGMLLALTRFTDLATVGRFAYVSAIVNPIMLLAQMQLRNLQAVDVGRRFTFENYAVFRLISIVVALTVILIIAIFHSMEIAAIILALAVTKSLDSISDIFQGAMQQLETFRSIGISTTSRGVLNGTCSVLAIIYYRDLNTALLALVLAGSIVTFAFDLPLWLKLASRHDPAFAGIQFGSCLSNIRKIGIAAFPLGCATFLASIEANLPRYFLSIYTNETSLGIYSTIAAFSSLGTIFINAMGQAAAPRLARLNYSGNIHGFRSLVGSLVLVGIASGLLAVSGASIFGDLALSVVFGRDESAQLPLLLLLLLASTVTYAHVFIGTALSAAGLHETKSRIQFGTVCASTILLFLLTPRYGLYGAAASLAATAALTAILYASVVNQIVRKAA